MEDYTQYDDMYERSHDPEGCLAFMLIILVVMLLAGIIITLIVKSILT